MRARHRDEVLRSVESHGLVPQGSEVTEIAAGSTTKIKNGKRRLALYRIKECRVILADIVVSRAVPESPGEPIVTGDRRVGEPLDLIGVIPSGGAAHRTPAVRLGARERPEAARNQACETTPFTGKVGGEPTFAICPACEANPRLLRSTIAEPSLTRVKRPRRFLGRRPQMHGQIPPHLIDTVNRVVRTSRRMLNEIGREPTPEEVAAKLSMPLEKVQKLLEIAALPIRLGA